MGKIAQAFVVLFPKENNSKIQTIIILMYHCGILIIKSPVCDLIINRLMHRKGL